MTTDPSDIGRRTRRLTWTRRHDRGGRDGEPEGQRPPPIPYQAPQLTPPAPYPHGSELRHLAGRGDERNGAHGTYGRHGTYG